MAMSKNNIKKAFTLAETILVMTILGILAAIMVSTIKPMKYKQKSFDIQAMKILNEIDNATKQIKTYNALKGNLALIYPAGTTTVYNLRDNQEDTTAAHHVGNLYKAYLSATRKTAKTNSSCSGHTNNSFFLKDGSCIGFVVPGEGIEYLVGRTEEEAIDVGDNDYIITIFFDVNGEKEPNELAKDMYMLTLNSSGIMY